MIREASTVDTGFPYKSQGVCWIEFKDGAMDQHTAVGDKRDSIRRAAAGESELFAAWPGQWSTHLFRIDDIKAAAAAFGVVIE